MLPLLLFLGEFQAFKVHSVNVLKVFIIVTMTRNVREMTKKKKKRTIV